MWRASSSAIRCWSAPSEGDEPRASEAQHAEARRGEAPAEAPTATGSTTSVETGSRGDRGSSRHRARERLSRTPAAPAAAAAPQRAGRLFGMGRRRRRRPRGRRLQSRSLRVGRDDAGRPSRRAARARDRRSGAAHDRPAPDRSGRRGRLSHRRSRRGRREARRAARRGRGGARDPADLRSARRRARAICAECLAIQLKERDRFDPAMQALVAHLDLLAQRDFAGAAHACAASTTPISPT